MSRDKHQTQSPLLHVLAIGGAHQYAHFLPVAFEVSKRRSCTVKIFVPRQKDVEPAQALAGELGLPIPEIVPMTLPPALEKRVPSKVEKIARLTAWAGRVRSADALLCAERTSTLLKRLPGRCPPMIHIKHGAGDRAVGFEKRIGLFDAVLVQGQKDRARLIDEGVIKPQSCAVAGPVKVAAMIERHKTRPRLFDNDRPVILYNPHFNRELGSFDDFADKMIDAVIADDRYNLIVAPHVRLARHWSADKRAQWQNRAIPGRVLIDLGSERSIDMSYTLGADLYVGDVSSQVYEFIVRPRPCLFIDAHRANWRGNEDYAMWEYGAVIEPDDDIGQALARSFEAFDGYRDAQEAGALAAFDGLSWEADGSPCFVGEPPMARAASLIESAMVQLYSAALPIISIAIA